MFAAFAATTQHHIKVIDRTQAMFYFHQVINTLLIFTCHSLVSADQRDRWHSAGALVFQVHRVFCSAFGFFGNNALSVQERWIDG